MSTLLSKYSLLPKVPNILVLMLRLLNNSCPVCYKNITLNIFKKYDIQLKDKFIWFLRAHYIKTLKYCKWPDSVVWAATNN